MPSRQVSHGVALLEAAIECLQTVGYARTTARAVVERSNTNLGSIAYHFGSIENLRDVALLEAATRWLSPLIAAAEQEGSASEKLERGMQSFVESLETQRPVAVAFIEALAQADRKPELRRRLAAAYDDLRSAIGGLSRNDPRPDATASVVLALFDGLMLQWMIDPDRFRAGGKVVDELALALRRLS